MKKLTALFLMVISIFLTACSQTQAKEASLPNVMKDMKQKIINTQMMDLSESDLMPDYGINKSDVKQFAIYMDSTGTKGDEIVLIEGKDAGGANQIKEKLENRYQQKETEMKSYLPEEYAVLKKCRVRQDGNYISLIVSPQKDELEKIYRNSLGVS